MEDVKFYLPDTEIETRSFFDIADITGCTLSLTYNPELSYVTLQAEKKGIGSTLSIDPNDFECKDILLPDHVASMVIGRLKELLRAVNDNPCLSAKCGLYDEDMGCTCSPMEKWYQCPLEPEPKLEDFMTEAEIEEQSAYAKEHTIKPKGDETNGKEPGVGDHS